MELNSDMKLRLNKAAQLLASKQLVTGVKRRSCEATTSGYFCQDPSGPIRGPAVF